MAKLKAFRLNDYEWWAGKNLEEAIQTAMKETGLPREDVFDDTYYGYEETRLDIKILDEDTDTIQTLAEALAEMNGPGLVMAVES